MAHTCCTHVQKQKHVWHQITYVKQMHHTHALIHTKYLPRKDPPYNQQCLKFYNLLMQNYSWWNSYQYTGTPKTYCICSPCSQLQVCMYKAHTYNYNQPYSCNLCTNKNSYSLQLAGQVATQLAYSYSYKIIVYKTDSK